MDNIKVSVIIPMMMMLPFLRKLVKAMPISYFKYLFLLVLFFRGVLPILEYLVSTLPAQIGLPFNAEVKIYVLNSHVTENLFSQSILYFIGGYYFGFLLEDRSISKQGAIKWLVAGLIAIVISCFMTHYKITLTGLSKESQAQTFYGSYYSASKFDASLFSITCFLSRPPDPHPDPRHEISAWNP